MSRLRRFWFKFAQLPMPTPLNFGCGVTAYDRADALALIRQAVFDSDEIPQIVEVIEDVSIAQLEHKHVQPNLGNHLERGIWFPQGYGPQVDPSSQSS